MQHLCSDYLMLRFPSYLGGGPYYFYSTAILILHWGSNPRDERQQACILTPKACLLVLNQTVLSLGVTLDMLNRSLHFPGTRTFLLECLKACSISQPDL